MQNTLKQIDNGLADCYDLASALLTANQILKDSLEEQVNEALNSIDLSTEPNPLEAAFELTMSATSDTLQQIRENAVQLEICEVEADGLREAREILNNAFDRVEEIVQDFSMESSEPEPVPQDEPQDEPQVEFPQEMTLEEFAEKLAEASKNFGL